MNFKTFLLGLLAPKPVIPTVLVEGVTLSGDSILYSLADRLGTMGLNIHNLAQPGDLVAKAWARFPYDTRSTQHVLIEGGTNDLTIGTPPAEVAGYVCNMAERAMKEGHQIVLTGIAQRADHQDEAVFVNQLIATFCMMHAGQCVYANWGMVLGSWTDGLHPDDAMKTALVNRISTALRSLP